MDKPMSNLQFILMSLGFRFRDLFSPPKIILNEAGIKRGFRILDYGCGPGGFSIAAAELVGRSGKVYALDIHPLAVERVRRNASKRRLTNIETIRSDCATGLADKSVDVVLLYDIFHELGEPDQVLWELHRVLKSSGILSFSDHHMKEGEILSKITDKDLFRLLRKNKNTLSFVKIG